jgi:hypothetical protein
MHVIASCILALVVASPCDQTRDGASLAQVDQDTIGVYVRVTCEYCEDEPAFEENVQNQIRNFVSRHVEQDGPLDVT